MDPYVGNADPSLFTQPKIVNAVVPTNLSNLDDNNATNNVEMSSNTSSAFLVGVSNAAENSEQISVPSNLDTFPFTLTVDPPTNNQ